MRDYAKISPRFWVGQTGRHIRELGRDAQVVALYLLSCPSSNMIGLYYLPLPTLCHETGLTPKGARKALGSLSEGGFALWDDPSEQVFVVEMAAHQIGDVLKPSDNRVAGVAKEWQSMRKSAFYMDFYNRYADAFHLPKPLPAGTPTEGPRKPLRSQEQEQEKEQDQTKPPSQAGDINTVESGSAPLIAIPGGRK